MAAAAARADPIASYENQPVLAAVVGGSTPPSSAQVRDAIIAAGESRQWQMTETAPGKLVASRNVRNRHQVELNIDYDPQRYSITYRNSINMGYSASERTIHRSYNVWVAELVSSINASLARVKPGAVAVAAPKSSADAAGDRAAEISFWESVRDSKNPAELQAYLDQYPSGTFASLARARLATLRK